MVTKKFLIARGNSTLIAWDSNDDRSKFISDALAEVEQVGFGLQKNSLPYFEMMGNELSINGTLAFASTLGEEGTFFTSGFSSPVAYSNKETITTITMPLAYRFVDDNVVLFEGIGFVYNEEFKFNPRDYLAQLSDQYDRPAFGLISYKNYVLSPDIYVRSVNSCVKESACGSGSIAVFLLKHFSEIIQPSGGVISISKTGDAFTISAKVVQIQ